MSGHEYIAGGGALFEDDEPDDQAFLRNSRRNQTNTGLSSNYSNGSNMRTLDLEAQKQALINRQREIEQRTIDSSSRSIGILRDSEQIGIATAEELMKQREQLENSSKRLDEINANLRFSQKHINGIKSVFSSLKNYISGKNDMPPKMVTSPSDSRQNMSSISESLNQTTGDLYDNHPSARLRGLNQQDPSSAPSAGGSKKMNELLEANLDEMAISINRLKGLATNLGEEIISQNELIDNIQDKAEQADMTIGRQNKQMRQILRK